MRKQDFIDGLYAAGWDSPADGQHTRIEAFWKELFPVVAKLEDELKDIEEFETLCMNGRANGGANNE